MKGRTRTGGYLSERALVQLAWGAEFQLKHCQKEKQEKGTRASWPTDGPVCEVSALQA